MKTVSEIDVNSDKVSYIRGCDYFFH